MDNVTTEYAPSDVAQMLNLNSETLRKYALALEKEGYIFTKKESGHRQYYQKDVMVLNQFVALLNQNGLKIPIAAKSVVAKHLATSQTVTDAVTVSQSSLFERSEERYTEMMTMLEANQALLNSLLEERQKDKAEIQTLKESLSQVHTDVKDIQANLPSFDVAELGKQLFLMQQQDAATALEQRRSEEAAAEQSEPKKGLFSWFRKKNG
jgi:DNA-binding transcriptional MerR regulator